MRNVENPNELVTKQNLADFYDDILPYLGGMPEILANKFSRDSLYSASEKVIGCWTDGRPIYQKVIQTTTANGDGTDQAISIGTTVDNIISYNCILKATYAYHVFSSFNGNAGLANPNETTLRAGLKIYAYGNDYNESAQKNTIHIRNYIPGWSSCPLYITLQYTKTTDAANSFNFGTETDYSTTEKIVGTWIDGKPIYQKTIDFGTLPNNTTKSVNHNISNIDTIVNIFGISKNSSTQGALPLPHVGGALTDMIQMVGSLTQVSVTTSKDRSSLYGYVTLQYTKTS